jgi:mannose-6-phosphate isomerase-like protein (cupin superfamily)
MTTAAFRLFGVALATALAACEVREAPDIAGSAEGAAATEAASNAAAEPGPPAAGAPAAGAAPNIAGIRDMSGFGLWSAGELAMRNESLGTRIGPDFSARETLADYGNHRFRFIRRDGDGAPEQHDNIIDVVFVQSGEGVLQLGGTLIDPESGSEGEWRGSGIDGGERHPLAPGDVVHIPATVPHSFLVPQGGHLTYVLVKFPAP